jgi:hypothetical protein
MTNRVMVVGLLMVLLGYVAWTGGEQRRLVGRLSVTERRTVFENTLATYRTICADSLGERFQRYCDTQHDFLALFPECDTACGRLIAKMERGPTR